ncbi:hypothetical protein HN51_019579 [Arachis hypogaea]|uniref:Bifunctional inhibitor/plant lipid transfer protein/seed storage helical domain-containing protein n=1 Tax=Arachis hypogaea TaxID=3818 RepID=A0A445BY02_ARAHY|nr:protein ARABIDOPSIS THALIANA ANTHER 7 [Arachis hypogaea]RYR43418.1 hypothetical protein Ahy_A08g039838 [Arachis hypogaea]
MMQNIGVEGAFVSVIVMLMICRSEMIVIISREPCDIVYWDFVTCVRYLAGYESEPTKHCCETVATLNKEDKQYTERICQCIEDLAKGIRIKFDLERIQFLPDRCHMPITFPISNDFNCSIIQSTAN